MTLRYTVVLRIDCSCTRRGWPVLQRRSNAQFMLTFKLTLNIQNQSADTLLVWRTKPIHVHTLYMHTRTLLCIMQLTDQLGVKKAFRLPSTLQDMGHQNSVACWFYLQALIPSCTCIHNNASSTQSHTPALLSAACRWCSSDGIVNHLLSSSFSYSQCIST